MLLAKALLCMHTCLDIFEHGDFVVNIDRIAKPLRSSAQQHIEGRSWSHGPGYGYLQLALLSSFYIPEVRVGLVYYDIVSNLVDRRHM